MLVGSVLNLHEIEQIASLVDLVELRLDHFDIEKRPSCPCIFTLRKKEQGGAKEMREKERLAQIDKYLELLPDYCDIEADTDPVFIEKIAKKFPKVKLIGSYHNFQETPADLTAILKAMKNPHFAIYKIAVHANSTLDMLRLMLFAKNSAEPLSVMSMGKFGEPSRVLAPITGSLLNYTGLEDDPSLHRYGVRTLLETYHYAKLNKNTLIYALIGNPVEKSPGHLFHNPRFQHNAVYVKLRVEPHEVHAIFSYFKKLPFGGLSVTIPLKELVFSEMDEVSSLAKAIGAINTVTFKNGKTIGTNTDAPGALNALEKHTAVKGKTIAVLGAGGAARAIIYEVLKRGAKVLIFNRTKMRAEKLGEEFNCSGFALSHLSDHSYDILINTIPPASHEVPPIQRNTFVMDIVIGDTPLLKSAGQMGCHCIRGEEMFEQQALSQQKEWSYSNIS
jgi:3-dehydroquinate dehydratase/shikimate dehydrogenase